MNKGADVQGSTDEPSDESAAVAGEDHRSFRFFDNREKYLLFVTTCSEKAVLAKRVGVELRMVKPQRPALRIFDAGMGEGTVLNDVMRNMHRRFRHVPWLVVGKEISVEDVRLCFEKLADRFFEHPQMVLVITNMNYNEAPTLTPGPRFTDEVNWHEVPLEGDTSHQFCRQLRALHPLVAKGWEIEISKKSGNPLYKRPSVIVLYRKDQDFILDPIVPRNGLPDGRYDLVIASQPYRARTPIETKIKNVVAPLARALAPGGRMIMVQSTGNDPGMEIVHKIWPDDAPFQTGRHELLAAAAEHLASTGETDFKFTPYSDQRSLFRYRLHTLPSEVDRSIGLSTTMSAWNAAVYVAQIEDKRLEEVYGSQRHGYMEATQSVLKEHGGLWFQDESFVISRPRD
jgi:hypothetical protein